MLIEKLWRLPREDWIYKYGLAILLIVIPLYPKFPVFNLPGTYVAIRAEDFIIGILGIVWFLGILQTGVGEFLKSKLNIAITLFIVAGGVSLASSLLLTQTVALQVGVLHWARRIEYILPFFIAYSAIKRGTNLDYYVRILAIVVFLAFLYGVGQRYFQFPIISTQNEEYSKGMALRWIPGARLPSTFAGHYDLAAYLVLVFPILIGWLFVIRKIKAKLKLLIFLLIPAYWLFLQTEARVSFASYLIAVCIVFVLLKGKRFIVPFFILSVIGMFVLSSLGARYYRTLEIYKERLNENINLSFPRPAMAAENNLLAFEKLEYQEPTLVREDRSVSIRLNVEWPRAIRMFMKNPLLGTGYSSLSLATDNDYLRLLGEVGIVGTLAFFLVLFRIVEGFGKFIARQKNYNIEFVFVAGFLGAMGGMLVSATFIDVFEASKVAIIFWALAGLAYGVVERERDRVSKNE